MRAYPSSREWLALLIRRMDAVASVYRLASSLSTGIDGLRSHVESRDVLESRGLRLWCHPSWVFGSSYHSLSCLAFHKNYRASVVLRLTEGHRAHFASYTSAITPKETANMASEHLPELSKGEKAWERILRVSMTLPGAKVDRASYLASQLSSHCDYQQVAQAILRRPASAGISPDLIDKLADDCIRRHVLLASGTSFAAGLPGGLAHGRDNPCRHGAVLLARTGYGPEAGIPVWLARPA